MGPLRILHVVPSYLPATRYGGPIYSVHGLCRALAARGLDVHVFTTNVDGPADSDVPLGVPVNLDGVKVWYFPSARLRRLYWSPEMGKALQAGVKDFDIVHLHSIFLWPTTAAAREARRAGVPYVLCMRGMLVKELIEKKSRAVKTAWLWLFERRNIESAAALHVTSQLEAEEAAKFGYTLPKVFVVPNGVDPPSESSPMPVSPDVLALAERQPMILFLSRVNWKKGLDRLIPALQEVPSGHLVIAGNDEEGYLPTLRSLAAQYGVAERVTFLARVVKGADKEWLFAHAKVFVLPSYSENFGNVLLEALARGVPVVTTPEVGLSGMIRAEGAGIVAEGKPEALGRALSTILSDGTVRLEMARRGREAVMREYTWDNVARQMEECYKEVQRSG